MMRQIYIGHSHREQKKVYIPLTTSTQSHEPTLCNNNGDDDMPNDDDILDNDDMINNDDVTNLHNYWKRKN